MFETPRELGTQYTCDRDVTGMLDRAHMTAATLQIWVTITATEDYTFSRPQLRLPLASKKAMEQRNL
jgi:hypothetical protein